MNREVIIAIVLGFIIGLIITYGITIANKSINEHEAQKPTPTISQTLPPSEPTLDPDTTETTEQSLKLILPEPNTLTDDQTQTINGFTDPDSTIIIITEETQQTISPKSNGEFTSQIDLETGINYLTIFSVSPTGETQRLDQTIIKSADE